MLEFYRDPNVVQLNKTDKTTYPTMVVKKDGYKILAYAYEIKLKKGAISSPKIENGIVKNQIASLEDILIDGIPFVKSTTSCETCPMWDRSRIGYFGTCEATRNLTRGDDYCMWECGFRLRQYFETTGVAK